MAKARLCARGMSSRQAQKVGKQVLSVIGELSQALNKSSAKSTGDAILRHLLPYALYIGWVIHILNIFFYIRSCKIWITSPSGKTTTQLPLYQALRVVRERGWIFTKVEPVKPKRVVSRKEAVKIVFFGDNRQNGKVARTMEKQRGLV